MLTIIPRRPTCDCAMATLFAQSASRRASAVRPNTHSPPRAARVRARCGLWRGCLPARPWTIVRGSAPAGSVTMATRSTGSVSMARRFPCLARYCGKARQLAARKPRGSTALVVAAMRAVLPTQCQVWTLSCPVAAIGTECASGFFRQKSAAPREVSLRLALPQARLAPALQSHIRPAMQRNDVVEMSRAAGISAANPNACRVAGTRFGGSGRSLSSFGLRQIKCAGTAAATSPQAGQMKGTIVTAANRT